MNDVNSPKKPLWKSKAVIFATIFSCLFLVFFYRAVTNEPDYMPSQQNKQIATPQTENTDTTPLHDTQQMPNDEMKNMPHNSAQPEHAN